MKKRLTLIITGVILISLVLGGCTNWKLPQIGDNQDPPPLIKVNIVFRDGTTLQGYMRGLELGEDTTVFLGGQTTTNLYDADGEVSAIFNYAQVLYIKKVIENTSQDSAPLSNAD
ncbi:MAG: hypothetical protein ACM3UW_05645 [Bacillota bacterium]